MKSILKIFMAVLLFAVAASPPKVEAQRYFDISQAETLTNADTAIYTTTPVNIDVPYYYSVYVSSDSLTGVNGTGASGAKVYLQVCNDRTGTNWYTTQTLSVDGTGNDSALWEGICYSRRIRVYFIRSGTGTAAAKCYAAFKRVY